MRDFNNYFKEEFSNDIELTLPISIQIELTENCNFSCPFCYNNSIKKESQIFDINKWKSLLYSIINQGGVFQCAFSGGEPLLYKDELLQLFDILHEDKTGLMLMTNGYYLDESYIKKLCKYKWYWIQISLDSHKSAIHDSIRGIQGSYDRVINAIKNLNSYNLPVVISSVICKKNIHDIEGLVKLANKLNVKMVLFSPVLPVGRGKTNGALQLDKKEYLEYCSEIEKVSKKYTKIIVKSAQSYENQINNTNSLPPLGVLIRPNGDVKTDCISNEIVGNVFKMSLNTIWKKIIKEKRWKNIYEKNL